MTDLAAPQPRNLNGPSITWSNVSAISDALDAAFAGRANPIQRELVRKCQIDANLKVSPIHAGKRARLMVGCYRARDFVDVEIYVTALIANLGDFPEAVVNLVTDPKRGIPASQTFCPSLAEVVDACRKMQERIRLADYALDRVTALKGASA